jgi:hypothetical protein
MTSQTEDPIHQRTSVADPDLGSGAFLTLGSGMGKIRDEQPGSYFRELRNNLWVKIPVLKFFDVDPGWKNFGGMEINWIRDKHPGSATLQRTLNRVAGIRMGQHYFGKLDPDPN